MAIETKRFTFSLPTDVKDWLEEESATTGISQANLVLIALKTYIDQQKTMKMINQVDLIKSLLEQNIVIKDETVKKPVDDMKDVLANEFSKIGYSLTYDENGKPIVNEK